MSLYRNVRLGDFCQRRALTNKENFNHAHGKLWKVIECAYGFLKTCFPILKILKRMTPFPLVIQKNIIIACFVLHNFVRKYAMSTSINNMNTNTFRNNNVYLDDNKDEVVTHGTTTDCVNV